MNKQELLKLVHAYIHKDDDLVEQETLFELQNIIDIEILNEAKKGTMKIEQLPNGYIKKIEIVPEKIL